MIGFEYDLHGIKTRGSGFYEGECEYVGTKKQPIPEGHGRITFNLGTKDEMNYEGTWEQGKLTGTYQLSNSNGLYEVTLDRNGDIRSTKRLAIRLDDHRLLYG